MKKIAILLLFTGAGLVLNAQQSRTSRPSAFITISGAVSFPIAAYGSADLSNPEAGGSNTGYSLELGSGIYLNKNYGLAIAGFYRDHSVDQALYGGETSGFTVSHWKMYGALIGPLYTWEANTNLFLDFSAQSGFAWATTPEVKYGGTTPVTKDGSLAIPLQLNAGIRYSLAKNIQFFTGVQYMYLQPKFDITVNGTAQQVEQKMSVLNLQAGVGFTF
jgi:hypothetical protein